MAVGFDPDGPGTGGLFGLPHAVRDAAVAVLPVPFEATTSFGRGTAGAPAAILEASWQVDLSDPETGEPWRAGIALDDPAPWIADLAEAALADAERARRGDDEARARVDAAGERVADHVEAWTADVLDQGRIPAILGGDHSVPLGALRAAVRRHPGLGVLHVDAHADLRDTYEGFVHSHASVFFNALKLDDLGPVVQVGLRDLGVAERALAAADPRVHQVHDAEIAQALHRGVPFAVLAAEMVAPLPERVWVSFDVDGLDPSLCPGTGTPVPGGLSWREAMTLLRALGTSGRRIVGFDVVEAGTGPWDANVAARLLYKLAGWAIHTREER